MIAIIFFNSDFLKLILYLDQGAKLWCGQKISSGGQKISRGMVEKLVSAVENLVTKVGKLVAVWSKN